MNHKKQVANWYQEKHRNLGIPHYELERKWRRLMEEEEMLRMAESINVSSGGGNLGQAEPGPTPEVELVTESGAALVTETGEYIVATP